MTKIRTLNHEIRDDSVEDGSLEVKRLSSLSNSLLSGTKSTEVLNGLGNSCSEKAENNTATCLSLDVLFGDVVDTYT